MIKKYLRLESDYVEEDEILLLMATNAEFYIEDAGICLNAENPKLLKKAQLLALILIVDFYENRELTIKSGSINVSEKRRDIVQGIITQLTYLYGSDQYAD